MKNAANLLDTIETELSKHAERMADFPCSPAVVPFAEYKFHDWAMMLYGKLYRDLAVKAANPSKVYLEFKKVQAEIAFIEQMKKYELVAHLMHERARRKKIA